MTVIQDRHATRYASGTIKATQDLANSRYRARQRIMRRWIDDVADKLGMTREELLSLEPDLVSQLLRHLAREHPESVAERR